MLKIKVAGTPAEEEQRQLIKTIKQMQEKMKKIEADVETIKIKTNKP